jgi:transposase
VNGLLRSCGEKPVIFVDDLMVSSTKECGIYYLVDHLWRFLKLPEFISGWMRKQKATLEYAVWMKMMVANKLGDPSSKLGIFEWLEGSFWPEHGFDPKVFDQALEGKDQLDIQRAEAMKFYRAMDYLLKMKEALEKHLYLRLRDLFSLKVDLVFYDVTSSYFEGEGPCGFAKKGYSRDHEPGKNQVILGLLMCNGFPIGIEVFEGSRVDKKTVKEVLKKLKEQFEIQKCIFVGDRGLVTMENLEALEREGFESILALKKRRNRLVKKLLLAEGALIYCHEAEELQYREMRDDQGIRYVVCRNPIVAEEQRAERQKNLKDLEKQLKELKEKTDLLKRPAIKTIVKRLEEVLSHKKGRRFFTYTIDEKRCTFHYCYNQQALELEEELDGVYILRTPNEALFPLKVIEGYKQLADVERAFRTMKSSLDLRPFFHHKENRVKAHAMVCFLAFLMEKIVERRLKERRIDLSGPKALKHLKMLGIAVMEIDGERYAYVSKPTIRQQQIFNSLKIKTPPRFIMKNAMNA